MLKALSGFWEDLKGVFRQRGFQDALVVYVRYKGQYLFFRDEKSSEYWPILLPVHGLGDLSEDVDSIKSLFRDQFGISVRHLRVFYNVFSLRPICDLTLNFAVVFLKEDPMKGPLRFGELLSKGRVSLDKGSNIFFQMVSSFE